MVLLAPLTLNSPDRNFVLWISGFTLAALLSSGWVGVPEHKIVFLPLTIRKIQLHQSTSEPLHRQSVPVLTKCSGIESMWTTFSMIHQIFKKKTHKIHCNYIRISVMYNLNTAWTAIKTNMARGINICNLISKILLQYGKIKFPTKPLLYQKHPFILIPLNRDLFISLQQSLPKTDEYSPRYYVWLWKQGMIRKSTWEAFFKHPKALALPSNWQELRVFPLLLCHVALVTGTTDATKEKKCSALKHILQVWVGTCVTG